MRVLFASTRGTGHFNPLVPFIEAALRGGHEVMVAGPPTLADTVERAGYPFWEGASPPEDELGAVWSRVPTASPEEADAIVIGEIFGRLNSRAMLPSLSAACEEWRPDAVLREEAEFASAIAAERHRVPHAGVGVSLGGLEEMGHRLAGPALEEIEPGIVERIRAAPRLTVVPAALEGAASDRARTHRFSDPAAPAPQGPDEREVPPLVYVSFGSESATMPIAQGLYAAVFETASELQARVVLALGKRDADLAALGPIPTNVRVEPWVNPAEVLAEADAAVSHGGFGTTLGAVAAGLPLVVVPLFGDQPHNARAIESAGAGVALWPNPDAPPEAVRSSIDPAALREAIVTVLEVPAFRRVAAQLAAEMAAHPPTDEALATAFKAS